MEPFIHKELSCQILGIAFKIHSVLGPGMLEHAYQEAMCIELELNALPFEREKVYPLEYLGRNVGTYFADIVVDNKVLLELKSVQEFHPSMAAQIMNYLKVSGLDIGYLINFHNRNVQWKRYVNERE